MLCIFPAPRQWPGSTVSRDAKNSPCSLVNNKSSDHKSEFALRRIDSDK